MAETFEGGCDCGAVRYRLLAKPLFVHCCHCRWCQRESGSAFALNALIESERLERLAGEPEMVRTPSESGYGQLFARCPACRVALWSHYAGAGPAAAFVRVGTLDDPDRWPPDIHIFTRSKQPWVVIPEGANAVPEYYDREKCWPAESLERSRAIAPRIGAYHAALADLKRLVANGPVEGWPGREGDQRLLKGLAACRFAPGETYTEKQASDVLRGWLAGFCTPRGLDHVTMRRELVDAGLLERDKAGAAYAVNAGRIADFIAEDARSLDPASVLEAVRRERESRKRERTAGG
ncbi:MAG: GFA family protein [Betaproteobacteria bacterium]|nr:GFA family protein [Betaproteobacteria bacterium]